MAASLCCAELLPGVVRFEGRLAVARARTARARPRRKLSCEWLETHIVASVELGSLMVYASSSEMVLFYGRVCVVLFYLEDT